MHLYSYKRETKIQRKDLQGAGYTTGNMCRYKTGIMCGYKTNHSKNWIFLRILAENSSFRSNFPISAKFIIVGEISSY